MTGPGQHSTFRFGNFELNVRSGELRKGRSRIRLQDQPLRVLLALLNKPGEVVSREHLRQELWPSDTFVDFEHGLRVAVNKLRQALNDDPDHPRYVETLPRRGYRFIFPLSPRPLTTALNDGNSTPTGTESAGKAIRIAKVVALGGSILLVGSAVFMWWFLARGKRPLTGKDSIVLADFVNTTGDTVFDDSLKRALAVSLGQSPYLSLVSDQQVRETLRMMGKPVGAVLDQEVAREVCERTQSKVMVLGAISAVGSQYLVTLEAVNCVTGASLERTGANAETKEKVLGALGKATSELRRKLGESLASVQKYDVPLQEATTSSLEALKAFSLGLRAVDDKGSAAGIPYFKRAIELDPNFATSHFLIAVMYGNIGETELASEYAKRAYSLRNRVTEVEKLLLEVMESSYVTGDLVKDEENVKLLIQTQPREPGGYVELSADRAVCGDYQGEIANVQKALEILPTQSIAVENLAAAYFALNRLDDAKSALDRGVAAGIGPEAVLTDYYNLAFLREDEQGMRRQFDLAIGKPGYEDNMLSIQSDTEAYHGRLKRAREYSRRAVDSAQRNGTIEVAAIRIVAGALREAMFGNFTEAKKEVAAAIQLAPQGRYTRGVVALALAVAGDSAQAQGLTEVLAREYLQDTPLNAYWLPAAHAQIELNRRNPIRALEMLERAQSYEMGTPTPYVAPLAVLYLRGYAHLVAGQNKEAAAEFQRIVEHPGIVMNSQIGPLARLGLGRARSAGGETAKARAAYESFLTLWFDADPDIPILKQAKAEYAKLQ